MINNSPEQIRLRRKQNTLKIVGAGTIAFGVWSFVKVFTAIFIQKNQIVSEILEEAHEINPELNEADKPMIFKLLVILLLIILIVELLMRLFVGISAILESIGKRRSILYIIFACMMIGSSILLMFRALTGTLIEIPELSSISNILHNDTTMSSVLIEMTSMIMLIEMVAASVSVRRLTGQGCNKKK